MTRARKCKRSASTAADTAQNDPHPTELAANLPRPQVTAVRILNRGCSSTASSTADAPQPHPQPRMLLNRIRRRRGDPRLPVLARPMPRRRPRVL